VKENGLPFSGKVALVTGSSRGIGRAIALELARGGADVAVNFRRDADSAGETACAIEGLGRRGIVLQANVADPAQVEGMFAAIDEQLGGLDLLVCNAATGYLGGLNDLRPKALALPLEVNVQGTFFCAQAAAPRMKKRGGGRIVIMTSPGAKRTFGSYLAVGVSKGALNSLVRYLAVELAPQNIVVNAVSPGICDTEALRSYIGQTELDGFVARTPRGRAVTPNEIATLVAFLCRDEASMICGQTIAIDGGYFLPF
jgi:enoyl-[acyl-carrier protein] reductase III